MKVFFFLALLFISLFSFGQALGLFTQSLERTVSDSTAFILVEETERIYEIKDGRIIRRIDSDRSISYEHFDKGERTRYYKNGKQYFEKVFIDSAKFYFYQWENFKTDSVSYGFEDYLQTYHSFASTLEPSLLSRIHQISATKKREELVLTIAYFGQSRDTIFSSKGSYTVIDTLSARSVEYTKYNEHNRLVSRHRIEGALKTYSYTPLGDHSAFETINEYTEQGLLRTMKIKKLTKDEFLKHFKFEYNSKNELIYRKEMISGEIATYRYSYK